MGSLYRIYIDEVGHGTVVPGNMENNTRFLTLTGVIMEAQYVKDHVAPELDCIKSTHFAHHHPDEPVILHANEMKSKSDLFASLRDPSARESFNRDLFTFFSNLTACIISVTVDKPSFAVKQPGYGKVPYTTCLLNLLERYYMYLQDHSSKGDVMIESGDKTRDRDIRDSYHRIYANCEGLVRCFSDRFTSKEIKLKPKSQNIAGLQLSDMVGVPIRQHVLREHNIEVSISTFTSQFYSIISPLIRKSKSGKTNGYGIKYLE